MTNDNSPSPDDNTPEAAEPAASRTLRHSLRERRSAAKKVLHLDRRVPRLDPPVFVRFKPIPSAKIDQLNVQMSKSKDPDKTAVMNARAVAHSCIGIFEKVDGENVSIDTDHPDEDWPVFDGRLAELLGVPDTGRPEDLVRALYLTDGDVIKAATELTTWSGYAERDEDEEFAGN